MPSDVHERSLSILIPAARMGTADDPQAVWGDVRVALASIAAYAPGVDVVLAWNGREEPRDLPANPSVRLVKQAEGIRTASAAWNFAASQTDADELLIFGDDCVLLPDSLEVLLTDVSAVHAARPDGKIGMVGARSNYVKGPQNIRLANDGEFNGLRFDSEQRIFEVPMIVPVAAWVRHEALDLVGGFPNTNWYGDDLFCWDLQQAGYHHFVSRAYVHHVGERATGENSNQRKLHEAGMTWLREHRPDFLAAMGES
jgi:GT2 family glycosyltransferase